MKSSQELTPQQESSIPICGPLVLEIKGVGHIPSFKNSKRAILDRNSGNFRTLTPGKIKKRMDKLENAILSALYSTCQTTGGATPSGCLKLWRTFLSGLRDDSVREIPSGSWDCDYVPKGQEGITIIIERINPQ